MHDFAPSRAWGWAGVRDIRYWYLKAVKSRLFINTFDE